MTKTIRERINKDEAETERLMPGCFPSEMQKAWIAGDLITVDEVEVWSFHNVHTPYPR